MRNDPAEAVPGAPGAPPHETVDLPRPRDATESSAAGRRVAVVSAVHPWPTDGGNKVVLAGLLRYFADRHGPGNLTFVLVGPPPEEPGPEPIDLRVVPRPGLPARVGGLLRRTVLGGASLQEGVLYSPAVGARLRQILDEVRPDLVVLDTIRMAQYRDAVPVGTRTVCYLDDLYSERYRSMLAMLREEPRVRVRPLASFATLVPRRLRWLTEWRPTQRLILGFEARRAARSEVRVADGVDTCLLVNENEVERLRSRATRADLRTIRPLPQPVGADHERPSGHPDRPVFVIMGVLSGPHNDLAVRWLLGEVLPLLLARVPGARIDVVGKSPSPEVQALVAAQDGSARLLGFVPDPLPHLVTACALLNPPRFASGIKLKVLDALAVGTPVVSTAAGAEGLRSGAEHGVLVGDSPQDFADAMCRLCDPTLNATVSAAARRHSAARFSRESVFAQYDDLFGTPAAGTPASVPRA